MRKASLNLATVLSGWWLSMVGGSMFGAAAIYTLTDLLGVSSASYMYAFIMFVPSIALLPLVLGVVDKWDKWKTILVCDALSALVCVLGAAYLFTQPSTTHQVFTIGATVFGLRCISTLSAPSIRAGVGGISAQAGRYSPQFLLTTLSLTVSLVAPLVVPIALRYSLAVALLINAASFLISAGCFMLAGRDILPPPTTPRLAQWREQIRGGVQAVREHSVLFNVLLTLPAIDLALAGNSVLQAGIAMEQTVMPVPLFFGLATGIAGSSRIIGAFVGRHLIQGKFDGGALALNCVGQALAYLFIGLFANGWTFLIALAFLGIWVGINGLGVNELIQHEFPAEYKGRVFTLVGFVVMLSMPFGPLLAGFLASFDLRVAYLGLGVFVALAGLKALFDRRIWAFKLSNSAP